MNKLTEQDGSSLIDVDKRIPWRVQQVHGITNEMLEGEPKPDEVLPEFYKFIAGSILVAHNASFDITICDIKKVSKYGKKKQEP